ncbi:MAG: DivIVA domain-containing protein [Proteobacteria bacterium]|nr:DivIVA domain-containing protein [Pseudomonadota bacterium]
MKNKLTPLEIHQQRFSVRFRGYNTSEVDFFLDQVSETLELMTSEAEALREKIRQLNLENQDYRSREESYKRVMLNSQTVLEQMKENARKSSEVIVAQAEVDADKIIQSAHNKLERMHDEVNELKRQQVQFRAQMKSMIEAHSVLLEMTQIELDPKEEGVRQIDYD